PLPSSTRNGNSFPYCTMWGKGPRKSFWKRMRWISGTAPPWISTRCCKMSDRGEAGRTPGRGRRQLRAGCQSYHREGAGLTSPESFLLRADEIILLHCKLTAAARPALGHGETNSPRRFLVRSTSVSGIHWHPQRLPGSVTTGLM